MTALKYDPESHALRLTSYYGACAMCTPLLREQTNSELMVLEGKLNQRDYIIGTQEKKHFIMNVEERPWSNTNAQNPLKHECTDNH